MLLLVRVLVLIMLGFMMKPSVQLKSTHPLHAVVDTINHNGGPYIALVMAYPTEELVLLHSGLFLPTPIFLGLTCLGIVHYGIAGSANDSLSIGDVSVPKHIAFTGSWKWKEFHSEKGELPELKFGAYNFPAQGENLLANIEFTPQQLYSVGQPMEEVFWLPVEPTWFSLASQLVDLKLLQCVNETYCLPETPKVVHGLRGIYNKWSALHCVSGSVGFGRGSNPRPLKPPPNATHNTQIINHSSAMEGALFPIKGSPEHEADFCHCGV
ncbi:phosphorylase superfamily protein [Actinidia rufa]|uniref:Phosphorylase superfamily protein n=1 Tax=Actinidia rufa TaxID=165716 RepID=A0A7J0EBV4_9ERIC|nr:phosphorylase superfamily protein [Actinidia rufa]